MAGKAQTMRRINEHLSPNGPQTIPPGTQLNVALGQNELAQPVVILTIGQLTCPLEPGVAVQVGYAMQSAAFGAVQHRLAQLEGGAIIRPTPSGLA